MKSQRTKYTRWKTCDFVIFPQTVETTLAADMMLKPQEI